MAKNAAARCVECAFYPWLPAAEPDLLPAQPCHPSLPWQRWTAATRDITRSCPVFRPVRPAAALRRKGPKAGEVRGDDADA